MSVVLPMTSSGYCVGKRDFQTISKWVYFSQQAMQKCIKASWPKHSTENLVFPPICFSLKLTSQSWPLRFSQKTFPSKIKPSTAPLRSVMSSLSNTLHKTSVVKSRVQLSFQKLGQSFFLARWWPEFGLTSPKWFLGEFLGVEQGCQLFF